MADEMVLTVAGFDRALANIDAAIENLRAKAVIALYQEAEIEMTEAKRRTPVDTGALRDSGFVEPAEEDFGGVSVRLGFGGASAPYAIYVHENLEAIHPVGEAKFLESTILESAPYLPARVAKRMQGLG